MRDIVADIRARAQGARPRSVRHQGVRRRHRRRRAHRSRSADKLAEYRAYASSEGALAHYSATVGVDFSRYGPDEPIRFVKTNAMASGLEAITVRSRDTEWTPRKLLEMMVLGSRQAPIVGSPARVADSCRPG